MRNYVWMGATIFGLLLALILFFLAQYGPWIILWMLAVQI